MPTPLPEEIARTKANCFNAVQLFWQDIEIPKFIGPEEFVSYLNSRFHQIPHSNQWVMGDVVAVWSRNSNLMPLGQILISKFRKEDPQYPYGLIIEHAFVRTTSESVFQKRDPTAEGAYELVPHNSAISPYLGLQGFELTFHRRKK